MNVLVKLVTFLENNSICISRWSWILKIENICPFGYQTSFVTLYFYGCLQAFLTILWKVDRKMKLEKMGCNCASKRSNTNCSWVIKTLINAGLFGSSITEKFSTVITKSYDSLALLWIFHWNSQEICPQNQLHMNSSIFRNLQWYREVIISIKS